MFEELGSGNRFVEKDHVVYSSVFGAMVYVMNFHFTVWLGDYQDKCV
jgi:hypothetical protein